MEKQTERPFQINGNTAAPGNLYREELNELHLEKLNNRVTLISILVPILIIVVLVVSYLDIKRKVSTVEVTGNTEYQQLSANAESKFSALSVKFASLEADLNKRVAAMDKSVKSMSSDINRVDASIKQLRSDKSTETAIKKIESELSAAVDGLQKDLKVMDANLESLDIVVKGQLEKLVGRLNRIDNRLIEQDAQMVTMTAGTVNRETLDSALKQAEERIVQNRGKDIKLLQLSVEDLQRQIEVLSQRTTPAPSGAAASGETPTPAPPPAATSKPHVPAAPVKPAAPAPKPGQIIEQPLQ